MDLLLKWTWYTSVGNQRVAATAVRLPTPIIRETPTRLVVLHTTTRVLPLKNESGRASVGLLFERVNANRGVQKRLHCWQCWKVAPHFLRGRTRVVVSHDASPAGNFGRLCLMFKRVVRNAPWMWFGFCTLLGRHGTEMNSTHQKGRLLSQTAVVVHSRLTCVIAKLRVPSHVNKGMVQPFYE